MRAGWNGGMTGSERRERRPSNDSRRAPGGVGTERDVAEAGQIFGRAGRPGGEPRIGLVGYLLQRHVPELVGGAPTDEVLDEDRGGCTNLL